MRGEVWVDAVGSQFASPGNCVKLLDPAPEQLVVLSNWWRLFEALAFLKIDGQVRLILITVTPPPLYLV